MRTIYKYPVNLTGFTTVHLPIFGKIVRVGLDPSANICFWVEMNLGDELFPRSFCIIGTGHEIPDDFNHIGSFSDGPFIWHMYMNGELK